MCDFSDLQPGEGCTLITKSMFCTKCGTTSGGVTVLAVYLGHSVDGLTMMDCFSIVSYCQCPNCKIPFIQYQQPCRDIQGKRMVSDYTVEDKRRANAFENYCETHGD